MPGQANITKFFRPIDTPKTPSNIGEKEEEPTPGSSQIENMSPNKPEKSAESKKRKLDDAAASSPAAGDLTPDQKRRAIENQLKAKIKLTSNNLNGALNSNIGPVSIGPNDFVYSKPIKMFFSFWTISKLRKPNSPPLGAFSEGYKCFYQGTELRLFWNEWIVLNFKIKINISEM